MLNKFVDWIMACGVADPCNATWEQIAKIVICYFVRLLVFVAIVTILTYSGLRIVDYAL